MRKLALGLVLALSSMSCGGRDEARACWERELGPEPRAEVLAGGVTALELVVDESDVYLADPSGIVRVPKSGGTPTVLHRSVVAHLTVDAENIYWTESVVRQAVFAMNKRSLLITKLSDDLDDAGAIAADGDMATAFASGDAPNTTISKFVYWVDEKTGAVRRVAPGRAAEVVASGKRGVYSVRVDRERVYWTTEGPFSISSQRIGGGDLQSVSMSASVLTFAMDSKDVFFDGFDGGIALGRFSKPAGTPVAVDTGGATRVAADGTSLFWTAHERCEVRAFDKATKRTRVIAANQARPSALATDGTHAYWTNVVVGTVMRALK